LSFCGAVHPAGMTTSTSPFTRSPAGAVYVKVSVPLCEAERWVGASASVPVPSAAFTITEGEAAIAVSDEDAAPVEASSVVKVEGTCTRTEPLDRPPVGAVYVKVKVCPVEEAETLAGETVSVPVPSAAFTVTKGEAAIAARAEVDALVEASAVVKALAPVEE